MVKHSTCRNPSASGAAPASHGIRKRHRRIGEIIISVVPFAKVELKEIMHEGIVISLTLGGTAQLPGAGFKIGLAAAVLPLTWKYLVERKDRES